MTKDKIIYIALTVIGSGIIAFAVLVTWIAPGAWFITIFIAVIGLGSILYGNTYKKKSLMRKTRYY